MQDSRTPDRVLSAAKVLRIRAQSERIFERPPPATTASERRTSLQTYSAATEVPKSRPRRSLSILRIGHECGKPAAVGRAFSRVAGYRLLPSWGRPSAFREREGYLRNTHCMYSALSRLPSPTSRKAKTRRCGLPGQATRGLRALRTNRLSEERITAYLRA